MRAPFVLAFAMAAAAVAACGRSGGPVCEQFSAQEFNETGSCLGPPVDLPGLSICHDSSAAQSHGMTPVCIVGDGGRIFRGWLSSTQWLEGASWAHSATVNDPSTLAPADEGRCAAVLPLTVQTCQ